MSKQVRKVGMALAVVVVLVAALVVGGSWIGQDVEAQDIGFVAGHVQADGVECYPSSYVITVKGYRYGPIMDVRDAKGLTIFMKCVAGAGTDSQTLPVIQWFPSNPNATANRAYSTVDRTLIAAGYEISNGIGLQRVLRTQVDGSSTTLAPVSMPAWIIASGDYVSTCTVIAPYCRVGFYHGLIAADSGHTAMTQNAWMSKRFEDWPDTH